MSETLATGKQRAVVRPEPLTNGTLSAAQIDRWRRAGALLVDDLFPQELIEQAQADGYQHFPQPGSDGAQQFVGFGSLDGFVFPTPSEAINAITLHPNLLGACAALLGEEVAELRLTQSDLWPKYGREPDPAQRQSAADQRIHVDYPNHTIVHPQHWDHPEAVEIIVYLSDANECGGGTAFVERTGPDDPAYPWPIVDTPGVNDLHYVNDRTAAEAYLADVRPEVARWRAEHLYPREQQAHYRPGTVLLYRHDLWHRGTPMVPGTLRLALNITFRRAACEWIGVIHPGWAWSLYSPKRHLARLLATASPDQRTVLGFPGLNSSYWNEHTLAAVESRYRAAGFDATPYREALAARSN